MSRPVYDILEFGAAPDRLNTEPIQKAIDACHQRGGGIVNVPPGVFRTGGIVLKSHVELHLESNATLLGSTDRNDYVQHRKPTAPVGEMEKRGTFSNFFCNLIHAADAEGIAITGRGTIDGNGRAFFTSGQRAPNRHKRVRDWRPGHLIGLVKCNDVLIRDVRLIDSPCYFIWPRTCRHVRIEGITILGDPWGPNTDGIDPDGCTDVLISNCLIDTGDDAIAPKSGFELLCPGNEPMDGLVVTNCILKSTTCGVRLGYEGDGPIRNCAFSNLVMQRTRTGINMLVPRHPERDIHHGPSIENISFQNIVMDTRLPIFLWIAHDAERPGCIRNINISDVLASGERASYIGGGRPDLPLESVRLRNIRLNMRGSMNGEQIDEPLPHPYRAFDYWPEGDATWPRSGAPFLGLPHALYARFVHDLDIRDLRIDWAAAAGHWHSAIHIESAQDVHLDAIRAEGAPGATNHPVIDWGS